MITALNRPSKLQASAGLGRLFPVSIQRSTCRSLLTKSLWSVTSWTNL
jgi:hypothetical protein